MNPSRSPHLTSRVWCQRTARVGPSAQRLHDRTLTYRYLAREGLDRRLRSGRYWTCVFAALSLRILAVLSVV
jgi:hypothetical protein